MSTTLTIPDVDELIEENLRMQAASHGRTMEAEAREILKNGVGNGELAGTAQRSFTGGKFDHLIGIWKDAARRMN